MNCTVQHSVKTTRRPKAVLTPKTNDKQLSAAHIFVDYMSGNIKGV